MIEATEVYRWFCKECDLSVAGLSWARAIVMEEHHDVTVHNYDPVSRVVPDCPGCGVYSVHGPLCPMGF